MTLAKRTMFTMFPKGTGSVGLWQSLECESIVVDETKLRELLFEESDFISTSAVQHVEHAILPPRKLAIQVKHDASLAVSSHPLQTN